MKNKKIKWVVIISAVVIIAVIAIKVLGGISVDKDEDAVLNSEVEYKVLYDNISVSVTGSGSLNPTDKRVIKSEIDGIVEGIYVAEGNLVEKEQVLISLKSDSDGGNQVQINGIELSIERAQRKINDLYNNKGDLNIYAGTSGIISNINIEAGDEISANSVIGMIKDTSNSYIDVYFLKNQFEKINLGDKASTFMTKYFSTETGTVSDKDGTPVQMGGGVFGYKVTVKINNPGGFSVGDLVQVTVNSSEESFQGMDNGRIVEVKEENIVAKVGGEIKSINIENGKYVNEGDRIATIEGDDIDFQIAEQQNIIEKYESQLNDLVQGDTIYSPVKGTVLKVGVSEDEVVDRTTTLMTVADLENMEVVLAVDELDIMKIKLGQQANITSDAFKDEEFTGKVTKISMEGLNQSGVTTYDVTIKLDDRKLLMSGMNLDIEIFSDKRDNVLVVPIDAVQKINGKYVVSVKDSLGNKEDVNVELGLATKDNVEIVSGIKDGDIIVYNKIQSDGSSSFNGVGGAVRVPGMGGGRRD